MAVDINYALFALVGILAYAIIRTFLKEKHARKFDIDYACGFVSNDNTPEGIIKLREESRRHMEQRGFHFDYAKADAENAKRRAKREAEREELKERFLLEWEKEKANKLRQKEVLVPIAELQKKREITMPKEEYTRERGINVLYPRNSKRHTPPQPPRPRKRVKKRDGTSTYQLGQDISPVWGTQRPEQNDKTMQNSYKPFKEWHQELEIELAPLMPDDYPPNPEQAFRSALGQFDDVKRERQKEEIMNKTYTVQDYRENLRQIDELRKRLGRVV